MSSQSPPPLPTDAEIVRNIEVLAAFVAKTGAQFEQLARVNTTGDPKFGFLLGNGPPGSEAARSHAFYQWKKQRLEQRVFATDGSDDLQLKICAMVDEARTPSKAPSSETRALDEANAALPGAAEKKRPEAIAGAVQKAESSPSNNSVSKPERPPVHRAKGKESGDMKPPSSTAPLKRKADSIAAGNTVKKGAAHEDLDASRTGDSLKRKIVSAERPQKAGAWKEVVRGSPGSGPCYEARAAVDVGADEQPGEATEKHCKESHGLRLLKSALADYVKEVLKPAWKEGNMSKEAFKSIVKKVVDKVIGSLQAHQIPKTQENVDQYMAQSEAKISKLVQGYVDRLKKN